VLPAHFLRVIRRSFHVDRSFSFMWIVRSLHSCVHVDHSFVRVIRWIILCRSLGHSFVGVIRWVIPLVSLRGSSLGYFVGFVGVFCPLLVVCGLFVRDSK
jgi:hypothetical protein